MATRTPRAHHIALVAAGGALGTLARHLIEAAAGSPTGAEGTLPASTLAINLAGALALGVIVTAVPRGSGGERVRLLLGTGLLGGFTTYSTFAVQSEQLLESAPAVGIAYLLATVFGGFACAVVGVAAGRSVGRRRR